jgi:hypothetical protein
MRVNLQVSVEEKDEAKRPDVVANCPVCGLETFRVIITDGGHGHDESGVVYWFGGDGHCDDCGHVGYHSDSSR